MYDGSALNKTRKKIFYEPIENIKSNQIKSFIGPQVNNIHINKNDYTITYIYFVAGELQDSSGCFPTSSPGSEK